MIAESGLFRVHVLIPLRCPENEMLFSFCCGCMVIVLKVNLCCLRVYDWLVCAEARCQGPVCVYVNW